MDGVNGHTIVVTGANSGVGLETARRLARLGAQVVMVSRNRQKGEQALDDVRRSTGNHQVDLLLADLSSQAEVRRLAAQLLDRYPRVHVLVHNAGVILPDRRLSPDGIEMNLAVNHLAPFLLTHLLQDRLVEGGPARIINVCSDSQQRAKLDLHDLQAQKHYSMFGAYGTSKLLQTMCTYELARRLSGSGVTANCLHPGAVRTGLGDELHGMLAGVWWVMSRFLMSPEQGAQNSIYVATAPELAHVSGQYFVKQRAAKSNPLSYDQGLTRQVWDLSAKLCGIDSTEPVGPGETA